MNEIWKDVPGYEGLYSVSTKGRVYSHKTKKYLSAGNPESCWGYVYVCLNKHGKTKQFSLHRLVAKTFIPNPDNFLIVHHIDGNPQNNSVDNLKWCTQKENVHHCIESGKFGKMSWGKKKTQ